MPGSSLLHYGIPRRSGRYPWGSGEDPQRSRDFLGTVSELKKKGLSEVDIAEGMGLTTTQLRAKKSIAKAEQRQADSAEALRLKNKGCSNIEIGKRMGLNESSVRALLNPTLKERSELTASTAETLKKEVAEKGLIDVGIGVERYMGVSRTKLKTSIAMLEEEGYVVHYVPVEQLGTGKKTSIMVLSAPNVPYADVYKNKGNIKSITSHSEDGGRSFLGLEPVRNISSKRIHVKYAEDGGTDKDGVIEIRRGVEDISLGKSRYAQVRIGVDGTHYLKGMAMYSDDLPNGVDIVFNTNKHKGTPLLGPKDNTVLKTMKSDIDNPFGATVRQNHYIDSKGKSQLSALNIVNEEGDWGKWSKTLSSQMLSKQKPSLAKKQLELAFNAKKEEYDEIASLTNPAVKKKLLDSFSDDCDSSAVHLKAAAMPRQGAHVILPFPKMKENEVYAPNYKDGEQVVLVRYPHGGIFEIPSLIVNNKNREANSLIHNARDAIGINPEVAKRLSVADFDVDTVLVIPNSKGYIKTSSPLKGLENFDPTESYKIDRSKISQEAMPTIKPKTKQMKMGDISNLITDMTIKGANQDEIARAVRHSMVVIDAEKHDLNYKQSFIDNGIASLKKRYQGGEKNGASTLISRSSSEKRVGDRKMYIDPLTGKKTYAYTNETYVDKKGKTLPRTTKSSKMAETEDALTLSSGTSMEMIYATHANKLKALANQSRKESLATTFIPYSPSAKKVYANEVATLNANLNLALMNSPLERQAQVLANSVVAAKKRNNPDMDAEELKKIKGQALAEARVRTGAKKHLVPISDREWEAIQAGAISTNTLTQILNNTDLDRVKELATPRTTTALPPAKLARAKSLLSSGYTQSEVANALGISITTLNKSILS